MSANDSFAAALRNLGGIHTVPKPQPKDKSAKKKKRAVKRGESGSSRQETEGTGNSSATPDPELQVRDPELDSEALEVESPVHEPKKKKKKIDSSHMEIIDMTAEDPGKEAMDVADPGVELGGGSRPGPKFGKYPVKKVIGLMSELPSDQDWEVMEDQGLVENFKEIGDLWGQLGGRLAGFNTHALANLKKEREFSAETLARVRKLDKDLDRERSAREALEASLSSKIKEAELKKEAELAQEIKDAEARADDAEKRASGLEKEVAELKKKLESRKAPTEVVAEFQKSQVYADALAKAAAAEVMRCWTVAEKHIKTDPGATAQSFIDLYIDVKNKVNAGGAEPEPYVAPGQDVDSDSSADSEPVDEEIPVQDSVDGEIPAQDPPADDLSVQVPPPA
ncbi:uncharacterized protein LOC108198426 [Daucus carota subsp. sativus]|uniref:uncharacterized protein LOC108198426 n=1 Tax=Daucus carota subsp. sativus TaxID=79200 RepID=UPI003082B450